MDAGAQCSCTCLNQKFRLLWIGRVTSLLEAKALAEEFGKAAGNEQIFLEILKRATDPDYGFL